MWFGVLGNNRFIRSAEDNDESSWERRLAKKYYDRLYKGARTALWDPVGLGVLMHGDPRRILHCGPVALQGK